MPLIQRTDEFVFDLCAEPMPTNANDLKTAHDKMIECDAFEMTTSRVKCGVCPRPVI